MFTNEKKSIPGAISVQGPRWLADLLQVVAALQPDSTHGGSVSACPLRHRHKLARARDQDHLAAGIVLVNQSPSTRLPVVRQRMASLRGLHLVLL